MPVMKKKLFETWWKYKWRRTEFLVDYCIKKILKKYTNCVKILWMPKKGLFPTDQSHLDHQVSWNLKQNWSQKIDKNSKLRNEAHGKCFGDEKQTFHHKNRTNLEERNVKEIKR